MRTVYFISVSVGVDYAIRVMARLVHNCTRFYPQYKSYVVSRGLVSSNNSVGSAACITDYFTTGPFKLRRSVIKIFVSHTGFKNQFHCTQLLPDPSDVSDVVLSSILNGV